MNSVDDKISSVTGVRHDVFVRRWFDRHLHIRDGRMMRSVLPSTLDQLATGAIIMPKLTDPITTIEKAKAYRDRITTFLNGYNFVPCMTLYLTDQTDPAEVVRGFEEGVWRAVKLYIADQEGKGGTTGSAHGVRDLLGRYRVFEAMEKHQIPLLGHFEVAEKVVDEFYREIASVDRDLKPILKSFPGLPVVFEHLTDKRSADFIAECDHPGGLYATVTPHHLILNRNDLFEGGMNPGHWCKPVAKREEHRLAVRKYVTSGNRRFGAGTDSAPHEEGAKSRCYGCAAGIFTAPVAVELYTMVFDEDGALEHLEPFLSENFLHLYGMPVSQEMMKIEREAMKIPRNIKGVPVFKGGTKLPWKLIG
jgi:dihydroorotase